MRFPADVPTLTDGDITLRAHSVDDADAIVEQCTDSLSQEWTTVPLGYTREMALDWVTNSIPERWEDASERIFALETTHPDGRRRFSGSLSLRDEGDQRAELAFGAHPAVRGRGVMTRAVNLLLDYGFDDCHYETVLWLANVGNYASRRIAWKTGFTFAGVVPRWLLQRGVYRDGWIATLHRDDERVPRVPWHDIPTIESGRIRLRPGRESDVPRIVEACADPRTQYSLDGLPSPYTEADARIYLGMVHERVTVGGGKAWTVADVETDELLGNVGLPRQEPGGIEIGYWAHPSARGRGITTEAVSLVLRHLFVDEADGGMGLRRAVIKAAAGNPASQHVALANGFTEYGRERQAMVKRDGSTDDLVLYDLLADEWRAHVVARSGAGQP